MRNAVTAIRFGLRAASKKGAGEAKCEGGDGIERTNPPTRLEVAEGDETPAIPAEITSAVGQQMWQALSILKADGGAAESVGGPSPGSEQYTVAFRMTQELLKACSDQILALGHDLVRDTESVSGIQHTLAETSQDAFDAVARVSRDLELIRACLRNALGLGASGQDASDTHVRSRGCEEAGDAPNLYKVLARVEGTIMDAQAVLGVSTEPAPRPSRQSVLEAYPDSPSLGSCGEASQNVKSTAAVPLEEGSPYTAIPEPASPKATLDSPRLPRKSNRKRSVPEKNAEQQDPPTNCAERAAEARQWRRQSLTARNAAMAKGDSDQCLSLSRQHKGDTNVWDLGAQGAMQANTSCRQSVVSCHTPVEIVEIGHCSAEENASPTTSTDKEVIVQRRLPAAGWDNLPPVSPMSPSSEISTPDAGQSHRCKLDESYSGLNDEQFNLMLDVIHGDLGDVHSGSTRHAHRRYTSGFMVGSPSSKEPAIRSSASWKSPRTLPDLLNRQRLPRAVAHPGI